MTSETIIKKMVKDYLKLKNVFYWYNLQMMGAFRGIPDMFAIKNEKLYAMEIKTPKGKLSEHQEEFQRLFEQQGKNFIFLVVRSLDDIMNIF